MYLKLITSSLLFILLLSSCKESTQTTIPKEVERSKVVTSLTKEKVDKALKQFVDEGKIAGVSALIFEKNEEVYFNSFGYADRENEEPMDRKTLVQIYSMTKPISGVALMQQYEQGKFALDDPLSKYAPEFADVKVFKEVDGNGNVITEELNRPITVRDITRHTAGFAYDRGAPGIGKLLTDADPANRNNTLPEFAQRLASLPLAFQPGAEWRYGPSVDVQAYLVEKLSGQPYDQYLRDNIFTPLGMDDTGYTVSEKNRPHFASSYRLSDDGELLKVPDDEAHAFNTKEWSLTPGGWGLAATIDDYMKFARMLVNKGTFNNTTILKEETVKLMSTSHLDESITERHWLPSKGQVGFGIDFAVRLRPPATADEKKGEVGEFFWDGAASTLFWVDPKNELTAVLFVQLFPFDRIGLHREFRNAIYGD